MDIVKWGGGTKSYKPFFLKKWKCYNGFSFFLFGHPFRRLGPLASLPCFIGMKGILTTRNAFEEVLRFGHGLSGKGRVIYGWRCNFDGKETSDHHGNPMKRRLPSPAMCHTHIHTHTAPFPVPVIQPNSHFKYRFIHLKKNLFLRKKCLFLAWASGWPFIYKYKVIVCHSLSKGYILTFRLSYI